MKKTLLEYDLHVQKIKKLAVDTYGAALTKHCNDNLLPVFSPGILMLYLLNPNKPLPDMEMVLLSAVEEASKVPFRKIKKHFSSQDVINKVLDKALELTLKDGFGDLDLN
jgi:hypothetical protein